MGIKPSDYKLIQVHWNDASSHDTWVDLKKVQNEETTPCVSVGWLVADKPDKIVIVASIDMDEEEQVSGHVTIPKAMIVNIKELAVKKPRKEKKIEQEPSNNPA